MKITICLITVLLSGCQSLGAFVEEHPKAAGIAFAVAVAALATSGDSDDEAVPLVIGKPPCHPQPDGSCR